MGVREDYLRLIKDPLGPIVKKKPKKRKPAVRSVRAIPTAFESNRRRH